MGIIADTRPWCAHIGWTGWDLGRDRVRGKAGRQLAGQTSLLHRLGPGNARTHAGIITEVQ
jgi:hypothetical protein